MTRPAELPPTIPMSETPTSRPISSIRSPQWHYTSLVALEQILREGRIRTSAWRRDGRLLVRAAWTSAAAIWEPTATATNIITDQWEFAVDELIAGEMPPIARIGVATDGLLDWTDSSPKPGSPTPTSGTWPNVDTNAARILKIGRSTPARYPRRPGYGSKCGQTRGFP